MLQRWLGTAHVESVEYVSSRHAKQLHLRPEEIKSALVLLGDLSSLQRLNLEGLPLADRDVIRIMSLTGLHELDLGYTGISESAFTRLQEALPQCRIIR
jgi:hypothetical protein